MGKLRQKLRADLEAPEAERAFGSGWISGVLALALAADVPRRGGVPDVPEPVQHAGAAGVLQLRLVPLRPAPGADQRLRPRGAQSRAAPAEDHGLRRHRRHPDRNLARWIAHPEPRFRRDRLLPRPRLVPDQHRAARHPVHPAGADVRQAAGAAGVPHGVARGPVLFPDQQPAGAVADLPVADARDHAGRQHRLGHAARLHGLAAVVAAVPGDRGRHRPHAILGAPRVPPHSRRCGASTPCIIRRRRWTGSPARACMWWRSCACAASPSSPCMRSASTSGRSRPTSSTSTCTRPSSTPTCGSSSAG